MSTDEETYASAHPHTGAYTAWQPGIHNSRNTTSSTSNTYPVTLFQPATMFLPPLLLLLFPLHLTILSASPLNLSPILSVLTNTSHSLTSPNTRPWVLPTQIRIPDTDMLMNFGVGIRQSSRRPIDSFEMRRLLTLARQELTEDIRLDGADTIIPIDPLESMEPGESVQAWSTGIRSGNGRIKLHWGRNVQREYTAWPPSTWQEFEWVLRGVEEFVLRKGNFYVNAFNFFREGRTTTGFGFGYVDYVDGDGV